MAVRITSGALRERELSHSADSPETARTKRQAEVHP
jgi:hypothetical protein